MTPRIPPLAADQRDREATELLAPLGSLAELNIFTTLVRHPQLFPPWLGLGGALLNGRLDPRDRELLILRTAHLCESPYEIAQHRLIARAVGVTDEELDLVSLGPDAAGWASHDADLLRAADELHLASRISDRTWARLAERHDDQQLIELCILVGHYHLVAFALNSLDVEVDPIPSAPSDAGGTPD